jgi:hypothetical protein
LARSFWFLNFRFINASCNKAAAKALPTQALSSEQVLLAAKALATQALSSEQVLLEK